MGKRTVELRNVDVEEQQQLRQLAKSRTKPARLVQRAQVIVSLLDVPDLSASQASRLVGFKTDISGANWVKRFNQEGIDGLDDKPRSGKPPTHPTGVKSQLISLALQKPASLGYPFQLWTLNRLQTVFLERQSIHLSDSTIWTWLENEGLNWKRQQSWFRDADQHDPEFVEKRGPSFVPTSPPPNAPERSV